jgi:5-methylcytosine-specific restriction endonuclease McrA
MSRTGQAGWIALRRAAIHHAQTSGHNTCERCGQPFNWTPTKTDASPELDHRTPYALTGLATPPSLNDVRLICRRCNRILGGRLGNARMRGARAQREPIKTIREW